MGLFWDLIQHNQIQNQETRANSLEQRVAQLESDLLKTRRTLNTVLERLETRLAADLNDDGRIGGKTP